MSRYAVDRHAAEKLARDEYSMLWAPSRKRQGDHERALRHVVGVLLFGDDRAPEPDARET